MRLPVRPMSGRWPRSLERRFARFFWPDPRILTQDDADPEVYRRLMSQIYVGGTIKITSANRHPEVDQLLVDNLDTRQTTVADVGASDGTTSLELIDRLNGFAAFIIADRHLRLSAVDTGRHLVLFDQSGDCILIGGHRILGWPSLSRWVRLLYSPLIRRGQRAVPKADVLLVNPLVRQRMRQDDRISVREHDVFTIWPEPRPDVIKVGNLLRRLYFSDADLIRGLTAVGRSLPIGGHLLLAENPRAGDDHSPRGALYRRESDRYALVAAHGGPPELAELITRVRFTDAG